jgi:hypothetical protein
MDELENMLHVRFGGKSRDIPLAELNIGEDSTDAQICDAAAERLAFEQEQETGVPQDAEILKGKLRDFAVDRNPETNSLTLRPEAIFG